MPKAQSHTSASGVIRLSQDIAKLVNNPDGSDVRFLVGGADTKKDGDVADKIRNNAEPVTMYGHSLILRYRSKYFNTLFSNDWKEKSNGVIRKPNISHVAFHALLHYIYTGNVEVNDKTILLDLIAAAEEMELDELSVECQASVIKVLEQVSNEGDDDDEKTAKKAKSNNKNTIPERLSFNLAVGTFLVPGLILAHQHTLPEFFQELLDFTLVHMEAILESTVTLAKFLDNIPPKLFKQILTSDSLPLAEFDVWDLALNWACHHTKVLKPMVESQLKINIASENDEDAHSETESSKVVSDADAGGIDQPLISAQQLIALNAALKPLTPVIRFTLFEPEQYAHSAETLTFFLPVRRSIELQRFFSQPNNMSIENPRAKGRNKSAFRSDIVNRESLTLLKKWIIEANGIAGCNSPANLRFKKLHQASVNGFQASIFHQRCNNQGPTLVLVKSSDGYLFGGVNFNSWLSNGAYSNSSTSFLFALEDGMYRQQSVKFTVSSAGNASFNNASYGPTFGSGHDLHICDQPDSVVSSYSGLPNGYTGTGASNTALAGAYNFTVADYEVFSISKE